LTLQGNTTIQINGNLIIFPSAQLTLSMEQQNQVIADSCEIFGGHLVLEGMSFERIGLISTEPNGLNGSFSDVHISGDPTCVTPNLEYLQNQLIASFIITSCENDSNRIASWIWIIIGLVVFTILVVMGLSVWRVIHIQQRRKNLLAQMDVTYVL